MSMSRAQQAGTALNFLSGMGGVGLGISETLIFYYLASEELKLAERFFKPLGWFMLLAGALGVGGSLLEGKYKIAALKTLGLTTCVPGFLATVCAETVGAGAVPYLFAGGIVGGTMFMMGATVYNCVKRNMSIADSLETSVNTIKNLGIIGFVTINKDWQFGLTQEFNNSFVDVAMKTLSPVHKIAAYSVAGLAAVSSLFGLFRTAIPKDCRPECSISPHEKAAQAEGYRKLAGIIQLSDLENPGPEVNNQGHVVKNSKELSDLRAKLLANEAGSSRSTRSMSF